MNSYYGLLQDIIQKNLFIGKILVIYGPRQVGKTTLVNNILKDSDEPSKFYFGDDPIVNQLFTNKGIEQLRPLIEPYKLIVIDEAQTIENIGRTLKLIYDAFPQTQVIATGSSSFELASSINEPLTGRKREFFLYPLSFKEISLELDPVKKLATLNRICKYGLYPKVFTQNPNQYEAEINEITKSYLFKDTLKYQEIRKPQLLEDLLRALALQLGSEVSFQELALLLKTDQTTIQRYIHLLEQSFIIFKLPSFSRNLRNEINKSRKIYFYDIGIRNSLLGDFKDTNLRVDKGAIWENLMILERMKYLEYSGVNYQHYFWRTYQQNEIDLVEDKNGELSSFEFKWNQNKQIKPPKLFVNTYPNTSFEVINSNNFDKFVGI